MMVKVERCTIFGGSFREIGFDNMDSIVAVRPDGRITAIQGKAVSKDYPINCSIILDEALKNGLDFEHAEYYLRDKLMLENGLGVIKTNE